MEVLFTNRMIESNITRRRVIQGTGAIGVAGVVGSSVVTAQEDENGANGDGDQAAIRVAHASPDAPNVNVRLQSNGAEAAQEDEEEDDPAIEDLGFRDVSEYSEIDPGTYQVQVVVADDGFLEGLFDLFDGDGDEEQVIYDEEVDVEAGTAYTAVAFGEIAQSPAADEPAAEDDDLDDTEDDPADDDDDAPGADNDVADDDAEEAADGALVEQLAFGEHESFEVDAGDYTLEVRETEAPEDDAPGTDDDDAGADQDDDVGDHQDDDVEDDDLEDDDDRAFQVEILEDDLTDPGEDRSRLRVFHAVPDVDAVSIFPVEDEDDEEGAMDEQPAGEQNDTAGQDDTAGQNDTAPDQDADDDTEGREEGVREVEISPQGQTAYSGFAVGYFDPEAAAGEDGNVTDDNATDDGDNATDDDATDGEEDEQLAEDSEGEEFELITVTDSEEGERAAGGTNGLFSVAPTN